jgi:capsid assembly protein Gp20
MVQKNNTSPDSVGFYKLNAQPTRLRLIERLTRAVSTFLMKEDVPLFDLADNSRTSEIGAGDAAYSSFNNPLWRIHYDRRATYFDLKDQDINDPVISTALDVIASCVVGFEDTDVDSFEWMMDKKDDGARKVLDDLKKRLDLGAECFHMVREGVKYGEEFREVVVDDQMIIRRFKHLPAYQMMPLLDQFGNKQPGWQQRLDGQTFLKPIEFEEWQIVCMVFGAKRGWYGTGLMMPARRTWKRLAKMEDGMALARLIRSYDKWLHKIPVEPKMDARKQQELIVNYKRNMTRKVGLDVDSNLFERENLWQVETDLFIPDDGSGRGDVSPLVAQNNQLMHIEDLRYHQEQLLCRLKVPRKYLNFTSGQKGALSDSGLQAEDIQFARLLRQNQATLRSGLIRLASLALMLQGYDPEDLGINVNLAKISTQDSLQNSKVLLMNAQSANFFEQTLGALPPDLVGRKFMELSDDEMAIFEEFQEQQKAEEERKLATVISNPGAFLPGGAEFGKTPLGKIPKSGGLPQPVARVGGGKPPVMKGKGRVDDGGGANADDVVGQGIDAEELINIVAKLRTGVQTLLQKEHGISFGVGLEENKHMAREALIDAVLSSKDHH